jgi:hypothetical protein
MCALMRPEGTVMGTILPGEKPAKTARGKDNERRED